MSLATNRSTRPSPSRSAATTPRPRRRIERCRPAGHVDEPAAVVAEDMVGQRVEVERVALVRRRRIGCEQRLGFGLVILR